MSAYEAAIALNPAFASGYVNLVDLYRSQRNEPGAEKVLRGAAKVISESAAVHHALGLSLVRQKRPVEALEELRLASMLNPDNARYMYVYAVALNSMKKPEQAIKVLQEAHNQHPYDIEILSTLVAFHRDRGNQATVRAYGEKLRTFSP